MVQLIVVLRKIDYATDSKRHTYTYVHVSGIRVRSSSSTHTHHTYFKFSVCTCNNNLTLCQSLFLLYRIGLQQQQQRGDIIVCIMHGCVFSNTSTSIRTYHYTWTVVRETKADGFFRSERWCGGVCTYMQPGPRMKDKEGASPLWFVRSDAVLEQHLTDGNATSN